MESLQKSLPVPLLDQSPEKEFNTQEFNCLTVLTSQSTISSSLLLLPTIPCSQEVGIYFFLLCQILLLTDAGLGILPRPELPSGSALNGLQVCKK